jgi:transcriptional regulator with XRE-family HTH domain
MSTAFSEKLRLVLKVLSLSGARLAGELNIDKSVVSRWLSGAVRPSAHNLSLLTALVAARTPGFSTLDWERDLKGLAERLGADPDAVGGGAAPAAAGLPLAILNQAISTTALRGGAYEGLFRCTRVDPSGAGDFLNEHALVRRDERGLLRLSFGGGGLTAEGWVIPMHSQLYVIATDVRSGIMLFGVFNGPASSRADVFDGLVLAPTVDIGRTPTAMPIYCERVADLSDDPAADERGFAALTTGDPRAPAASVPERLRKHLLRDIGPAQHKLGGDYLLTMPIVRSLARGPGGGAPLEER